MMLRINEGDYSYASGLIRAKEPKLLGMSQFNRMLDAPSAEDAYKRPSKNLTTYAISCQRMLMMLSARAAMSC